MTRIAKKIEEAKEEILPGVEDEKIKNAAHRFLARTAIEACTELDAKAIVAYTAHGTAARVLSSFRGKAPIYTCMANKRVVRELSLSYGVYPSHLDETSTIEDYLKAGIEKAKAEGVVADDDNVVVVTKTRGAQGGSNSLEIITPATWQA
jgi:pyruvate kinase